MFQQTEQWTVGFCGIFKHFANRGFEFFLLREKSLPASKVMLFQIKYTPTGIEYSHATSPQLNNQSGPSAQ
jgi:hypothetical protein